MSDGHVADSTLLNSIIGEGTRFRGELEVNGLLRIDGDFSGTIRTPGKILVGLNGRARCNIYAETVVVGGVVLGNIYCTDRVIILSTGMLLGNIHAPRLVVEEGVLLNGTCLVKGAAQQPEAVEARPAGARRAAGTGRREVESVAGR
jgi:cytoskeletal protein CcmA (bactofilin family)